MNRKQSKYEDKGQFVDNQSVVVASDEDVGLEMTVKNRTSSLFESINPIATDKGRGEEGGVGKNQRKMSKGKKTVDTTATSALTMRQAGGRFGQTRARLMACESDGGTKI